jgi:DNA-binding winged helix-turn-helix (wHTH) protein
MRLAFDGFTFDSDLRVLEREGCPIHLTPKAFVLLQLLLERRPRPIAATEIMGRVWPGCFVSRGCLANLIVELRQALGDEGRASRYVRTIHRFGYAFCGTASEAPSAELLELAPARSRLVMVDGEVPLREGETIIGRADECTVVIPSVTVSRRHARILLVSGQATLEDLHSMNGTFVNRARVEGAIRLSEGDKIQLGSASLVYKVARAAGATEPLTLTRQPEPA